MIRIATVAGLIGFTALACAQSAPLAFEVASVKAAQPAKGPGLRVQMSTDAGRLTYSNVTIRNILTQAYKVKESQISGPDWLATERYDIAAKFPEGATKDQVPQMLQVLLAERFKVVLHRETKVMPVYALVPGKNGPKLHAAEVATKGLRMSMSPKGMEMTGAAPMAQLADVLSNMMDRPVMDMTETTGPFDIDLSWMPEEGQMGGKFAMMRHEGPRPEGGGGGAGETKSDSPDGPSLIMALQEKLGLKLEARKLPVDLLTIDHAEKTPIEN